MGLLYALTVYLVSWILYSLAEGAISYLVCNFDKWCINLAISTVAAYSLWHFKMWGAGDAKLFICYSALIPMGQYSKIYFNYYFASFLLLLAVFIPATVYLFLRSSTYFIKRFKVGEVKQKIPELFKEKFTKSRFFETSKILLGFFVLFLFFKILRQHLKNILSRILPEQNVLMLISLLIFRPLSKFFKKKIEFTIAAFVLLIIYFGFNMPSREQFLSLMANILIRVMVIMVLFPVVKKIIDLYAERTAQKTTPFAHWMFLGALIVWFI